MMHWDDVVLIYKHTVRRTKVHLLLGTLCEQMLPPPEHLIYKHAIDNYKALMQPKFVMPSATIHNNNYSNLALPLSDW